MSEPRPIWPTFAGDHRAAFRTSARGAVNGRTRWEWRARGIRGTLVDASGRIIVVSDHEAQVLDAAGSCVARLELPEGEPWTQHVLATGGLVTSNSTDLCAMALAGTKRWRKLAKGAVLRMHVAPDGALLVWSRRPRTGLDVHSDITRYGADGEERWSTPHAVPPVGYVSTWCMAVDDGGHLFALAGGRMGDGVSGDDVPTGGVAAYDPSGQNIFAIPEDGNIARGAHGLAHGVILFGYEARAYDEGGTLLWKADRERDDAPAVRISGLGLELLEPMSEEMPLVAKRGPGSYFQLNAAVDGDGNRYFVHDQRVVSIDPELDVRWSVRVPGANGWNTPAIGPDGTVLVTSDDGHLTSID